jgi:putative FmdB family regulatory protein
VAVYEYRCATCDDTFEQRRPMAEADTGVTCPAGHTDVRRLLSVFASTGKATMGAPAAAPAMPMGGGCGGGCACH